MPLSGNAAWLTGRDDDVAVVPNGKAELGGQLRPLGGADARRHYVHAADVGAPLQIADKRLAADAGCAQRRALSVDVRNCRPRLGILEPIGNAPQVELQQVARPKALLLKRESILHTR